MGIALVSVEGTLDLLPHSPVLHALKDACDALSLATQARPFSRVSSRATTRPDGRPPLPNRHGSGIDTKFLLDWIFCINSNSERVLHFRTAALRAHAPGAPAPHATAQPLEGDTMKLRNALLAALGLAFAATARHAEIKVGVVLSATSPAASLGIPERTRSRCCPPPSAAKR